MSKAFFLVESAVWLLGDADMTNADAGRLARSLIRCDPMGLPEKFSLVWRMITGHPDRISARVEIRRRELEREAALARRRAPRAKAQNTKGAE